jgi:hypothetical protein
MAAFVPTIVRQCTTRRLLFSALPLIVLAVFFTSGCEREGVDQKRQVDGLKSDLEETKRRLGYVQNNLASKDAELADSVAALEKAKGTIADLELSLKERGAQSAAIKAELDEFKKRDALVFADIAAIQQQGSNYVAIARYQKFIADYPKSPLVGPANAAIAQLNAAQSEVRRQIQQLNPEAREKDFAKTFNEGYMTLQELAPVLKKKTLPQVLSLLGRPNQTFNENTEIGYADRAVNPATGSRGMLIITFESNAVSALRVEYSGRKMTP